MLSAAVKAAGIDLCGGEYTLLAPSDAAIKNHNREVGAPIDDDILKYCVIEGKKFCSDLNADQKTLNRAALTSCHKFREN